MNIDLTDAQDPCDADAHDWEYDGGDDSVGINGGWICKICGALNDEPPPEDDHDPIGAF
jgi:hypothetical protein